MAVLFEPYALKGITLKNRVVMSPMCQYSAETDGQINAWHLVHLGTRALYGVGLIFVEATSVQSCGRLSTHDVGLWSDHHIERLTKLVEFVHACGAKIGIQLAHAGRKAQPGDEPIVGPTEVPFSDRYAIPHALTSEEIREVTRDFARAAQRAVQAGFDVIELHAAHGYLLQQFLSPLSNRRTDHYGGSEQNRLRFPLEVLQEIKRVLPLHVPLFVRVSAVEYTPEGYGLEEMVRFCRAFKEAGADLIDVSSGGATPAAVNDYPGYQVPYARRIRQEVNIPTMAVGILGSPALSEAVLASGDADLVAQGRALLRHPAWVMEAARELNAVAEVQVPRQYGRAFPGWPRLEP